MDDKCQICQAIFIPGPYSHNQKYCSRKCNRKAYYYSEKGIIQRKNQLQRVMFRYNNDPEFKKRWQEKSHRYRISQKGRETKSKNQKIYRKSINGMLSDLKYAQSPKRKVSLKRYTMSFKGKLNSLRASLKRMAAFNSIIHQFSENEWVKTLNNANGICKDCNTYVGTRKLTLDHIYPISKALKDYIKTNIKRVYTIKDVQALCLSCNISKNDTIQPENCIL